MKCPYCQQEMEMIRHIPSSNNSLEVWVWQCNYHLPVLYRRCITDPNYNHDFGSLIIPIKDKWYCLNLNGDRRGFPPDSANANTYTIEELELTNDVNCINFSLKGQVLKISKNQFTPDNAIDKLKAYLVFM